MPEYVSYFVEDPRQISALLSVAAVWLGLAAVGSSIGGRDIDKPIFPLLGWAAVVVVYTVFGTLTDIAFTSIGVVLGVTALISGLYTSLWGAFKDSPYEGFKPGTFPRSVYFHVAIFLPLYFAPYFSAKFHHLGLEPIRDKGQQVNIH